MKKVLLFISLLFVPSLALANKFNTGYAEITEMKVWNTYIDVYSVNNKCGKPTTVKRYKLTKEQGQMYSMLLSAMATQMKVNLNYSCDEKSDANILGVRAKRPEA